MWFFVVIVGLIEEVNELNLFLTLRTFFFFLPRGCFPPPFPSFLEEDELRSGPVFPFFFFLKNLTPAPPPPPPPPPPKQHQNKTKKPPPHPFSMTMCSPDPSRGTRMRGRGSPGSLLFPPIACFAPNSTCTPSGPPCLFFTKGMNSPWLTALVRSRGFFRVGAGRGGVLSLLLICEVVKGILGGVPGEVGSLCFFTEGGPGSVVSLLDLSVAGAWCFGSPPRACFFFFYEGGMLL